MIVRQGRWSDVGAMAKLAERHRQELASMNPVFWRPSRNAANRNRLFYRWLLLSRKGWFFVAEEEGAVVAFLIARRAQAPPVYDPGGPTILVDDFCVAAAEVWPTAGGLLLDEVKRFGRERHWRQMIVVAAAAEHPKLALLRQHRLAHTSSWWTSSF